MSSGLLKKTNQWTQVRALMRVVRALLEELLNPFLSAKAFFPHIEWRKTNIYQITYFITKYLFQTLKYFHIISLRNKIIRCSQITRYITVTPVLKPPLLDFLDSDDRSFVSFSELPKDSILRYHPP